MTEILSLLESVFLGDLSTSFWDTFLLSTLLSAFINIIAIVSAIVLVFKLSTYRLKFQNLLLGLFFLYSFSIILKYLIIDQTLDSSLLSIVLLYILHLLPLYVLIYLFIVSFIEIPLFALLDSYGVSLYDLVTFLLKRMKWNILLLSNFCIGFIQFDDTKTKFGDPFYFSFSDIQEQFGNFYISHGDDLSYIFFIEIIPLIIVILPAILGLIFGSSRINLILSQSTNNKITLNSYAVKTIDVLKEVVQKFSQQSKRLIVITIISLIPLALYIIIFIIFFVSFIPPVIEGAMAASFFKLNDILKLFTWISISIAYGIAVIIILVPFIFNNKICIIVTVILFITALIPQSIIGYGVSSLIESPNLRLVCSYFLAFGVFPIFFLQLSIRENGKIIKFANSIKVSLFDKAKIYFELFRDPINLSLTILAVLIVNDSAIISSIGMPENDIISFSYIVANEISNKSRLLLDNTKLLQSVFYLLFSNILIVVISPLIYGVSKEFGLLSFIIKIIPKVFKRLIF